MDIFNGDCLDVLKQLADNSVDSVVTDPPYGLNFMNKHWDYDVPSVEIWKEVLRVLKPGGHLLSFGGTRTYHRMVVNIEDAGFEIRDQIQWLYGSGFPKSLNIGKMMDKKNGTHIPILVPTKEGNKKYDRGTTYSTDTHTGYRDISEPNSDDAKQWEGWGTALKPANEPICLARKPISENTIAENVLKWGTGGINIDGCRVEHNGELKAGMWKTNDGEFGQKEGWNSHKNKDHFYDPTGGRFPANVIHDGSEEVLSHFLNANGQQGDLVGHNHNIESPNGIFGVMPPRYDAYKREENDKSASRFFFKAEFGSDEYFNYLCTVNNYIELCQSQEEHQLSVNTAETNLFLKEQVEDFVLNLVAIEEFQEDSQLKSLVILFMNEIRKVLKNKDGKSIGQIRSIGIKCLQELRHIITETLNNNHVKYVAIQKQISTMMIIQNLLNIDGFVEVVISNPILNNMVLGEKGSRIIYCAKSSKSERDKGLDSFELKVKQTQMRSANGSGEKNFQGGFQDQIMHNTHPTVKPVSLMRYLCRLITPPKGIVLDPFMGSGSTGIGAKLEGFDFVGIEREDEYCKIAKSRIDAWEIEVPAKVIIEPTLF